LGEDGPRDLDRGVECQQPNDFERRIYGRGKAAAKKFRLSL
jgi:hypothetical protein